MRIQKNHKALCNANARTRGNRYTHTSQSFNAMEERGTRSIRHRRPFRSDYNFVLYVLSVHVKQRLSQQHSLKEMTFGDAESRQINAFVGTSWRFGVQEYEYGTLMEQRDRNPNFSFKKRSQRRKASCICHAVFEATPPVVGQ